MKEKFVKCKSCGEATKEYDCICKKCKGGKK